MTTATTFGGDVSGTYNNIQLGTGVVTGVELEDLIPDPSGTYGNATTVPVITVDINGRVTGVTPTSISFPAETDPVWTAAEPNYGNLTQDEVITGNWDNTANPWEDNEVADNLTISGGTINNTPIGGTTPAAGTFTTLTATTSHLGTVASGTWNGTPISDAYVDNNLTINGGTISNSSITVADNAFTLQDNSDNTKQAQFELNSISAGTTRTYTLPDASGTIALTSDFNIAKLLTTMVIKLILHLHIQSFSMGIARLMFRRYELSIIVQLLVHTLSTLQLPQPQI